MNAFLLPFFEKALNRYLALDPEAAAHLKKLNHKVVQIEFPFFVFQLVFSDTYIKLISKELNANPDTIIKGTPITLLRMGLSNSDRKQFFSDETTITGDLELGQDVIDLFDRVEIDWEEKLAEKIGDVPAHQIGRLANKFKRFCETAQESLAQNVNEYLHEEKLWFPTRELLDEFFNDVDALRMDVDRIEMKIKQLSTQTGE